MPKERVITFVTNERLTTDYKENIGLRDTVIGEHVNTLRDLIFSLRHAVAHFDITVISENDEHLIDWVEFIDSDNGGRIVAKFQSNEMLPFLKYYTDW